MKSYAKNIDEFNIGQILWDKKNNYKCTIKEKSANSIKLFFEKQTKAGIDCENWFDMYSFNIRFTKDIPEFKVKGISRSEVKNNSKKDLSELNIRVLAPENEFKNIQYHKW